MFKVAELLKATKGRLVSGSREKSVTGISIDSRTLKRGEAFLAIKGDNFDGHDFIDIAIKKGAGCVVVHGSWRIAHRSQAPVIKVEDTIKALGDIARFHRKRFDIPVIAVTGSNGKTTAKEMLWQVLSSEYSVLKNEGTKNNHIGLPLTLLKIDQSHDIAVVEIGTNHFGEIENLAKICLPNIGIITNIGPSHLEFLGDLKGVLKEKYALIENLIPPRIAILNTDDALLAKKAAALNKRPFLISFGIKQKADFKAGAIRHAGTKREFRLAKYRFTLSTAGDYNIYNALSAVACARIFGIGYEKIRRALAKFVFPRGRLNFITLRNTRFIDDSYNSNPLSLKMALEALSKARVSGRRILIMGDMLELGKKQEFLHRQAAADILGACDAFISVGNLSKLAAEESLACGFKRANIFSCASAHQAQDILSRIISPGPDDIVLVKGSRAMKLETIIDNFRR